MAAAVASAYHCRPSSSSSSSSSSASTSSCGAASYAQHHKVASSSSRRSSRSSNSAIEHDRFYGHRDLAELCERVILALFSCPLDSTSSSVSSSPSSSTTKAAPRLSEFIAYALHRTRLPLAVTHQALFLLKRLKSRFPAARGSSGHRLFISALMLASKSTCDDTYSNKSWTIVGQGLFSLREVNQMERELFGYLGFRVNVEIEELDDFVAGLEQGRIHAPVEPPSPNMSSMADHDQFEAPRHHHLAAAVEDVEIVGAPSAVSPSAASEPCFPDRYAPVAPFSSRASIAGYPSMASQPMVSSNSVPGASSSDTALDRASANYRSHSVSQQYNNSHQRAYTVPPSTQPTHLCVPGAAPAVYYNPGSPSSSRGSISYGSVMSSSDSAMSHLPSPYDSAASSSRTTPQTPASEFADSPSNGDDFVWEAVDPLDAPQGAPAGTYDAYAAYQQHAAQQQQQQQQQRAHQIKAAAPRFTSNPFASSTAEASKAANAAAAYRYQQQQAYGDHPSWSS
ncbi:hypothetical protein BDZ90DRAFT_62895 [Jaminaea rosea]|uniref:Cyclin N-terminal domain-containing protein n=1 Tax=Jaminaea rosea TaxID=1569628 RepID=A0A316UN65_9BASI|nr:hypothetical protein BDZ90DRAFT_62895 [Jaminaea rosea]PWN25791.1 hypothetical protein BDZ90DRAFT_62895 [Jaminaea rosea]